MARNTSAAVPAEFHEMSIYAVPAGNTDAPIDLLHKIGAGELKIAPAGGLFAPPGKSLGATIDLKPGTYVYGCSIPVGGQDPSKGFHFQKGMVGTLGAK